MKRKSIFGLIATITCLLFFQLGVTQAQENREFTNTAGKKISGKVIAATDKDVTIQMADGRKITGGLNFFSKEDQDYIAKWRELNPQEIKYDFEIGLSKERTRRDKTTESNTVVVYEDWLYKVKIENRSKSGTDGTDLSGLELHYNIVITATARADQASYQHRAMTPKGNNLVKAGKVDLGTIAYLRTSEVRTDVVPVNHSELAPGWYYADGTKDEQQDDLEGIWLKLVKDGKVLYEERSGSKDVKGGKWAEPRAAPAKK